MSYRSETQDDTFNGMYRGVVVSNEDPLKAGRCRIRVFYVFDDIPDDHLPWAEYADPFMQGSPGSGGMFIPSKGSKVWCFFEAGDHMQPVYFAGAPSAKDHPTGRDSLIDGNDLPGSPSYPHNRVIRTPAGNMIELDDTEGNERIRVLHSSGSQLMMYENGDIYEYVTGNRYRYVKGDSFEVIDGSVNKTVKGDINISVDGNSTETVTGSKTVEAASYDISLSGNYTFRTTGDATFGIVGNGTMTAGGPLTLQATGPASLLSVATVTIDGAGVALAPTGSPPVPPP